MNDIPTMIMNFRAWCLILTIPIVKACDMALVQHSTKIAWYALWIALFLGASSKIIITLKNPNTKMARATEDANYKRWLTVRDTDNYYASSEILKWAIVAVFLGDLAKIFWASYFNWGVTSPAVSYHCCWYFGLIALQRLSINGSYDC